MVPMLPLEPLIPLVFLVPLVPLIPMVPNVPLIPLITLVPLVPGVPGVSSIKEKQILSLCLTFSVFNRRAGRLLDVAKSGYYNTELCLEDFEEVFIFIRFIRAAQKDPMQMFRL